MMNRFIYKTLAFALIFSMMFTLSPILAENEEIIPEISEIMPIDEKTEIPAVNGVIVKIKDDVPIEAVAQSLSYQSAQLSRGGFKVLKTVSETPLEGDSTFALLPVSEEEIPDVLEQLRENENVEYAQPNYRVALSEIDINQWGLQNVGQSANTMEGTAGYDINILEAWNITQGSADVVMAIVDSGIDIHHEALADKIWMNPNETEDSADDDGNGYIDDLNGWDFVNDDNSVYDSAIYDQHGTHVAGILSSVAPNVKIMPLKAFSYNVGYTFDIINAINYAEAMGVKIVNCSFASTEYNTALADAMELSNMLFVCAAGNYARSTDELAPFPACYGFDNILSVAAIDSTGALSPISTYGDKIDVAAPGINIYSTLPENSYGFKDGTSMAAAYASGAAALVLSNNSELSARQIRQIIIESATTPVIMPNISDEPENLLDVEGALEQEMPEPERETQNIPIPGEDTSVKTGSIYPFSFELENDELYLILDNNEIYQTVSISIWEQTDNKNATILLNENVDTTQTIFDILNFLLDTNYEFNIKFNNNDVINNFIGEFKVYFSDVANENVVNFKVDYNSVYATESYSGGDFSLMANVGESEPNNTSSSANIINDDDTVSASISSTSDVDWFKVMFTANGVANFWVGKIAAGCDFELDLYDYNLNSIATSRNGSTNNPNVDELIRYYPVTKNQYYYMKVSRYSGTGTYNLRAKWYLPPDEYEYASSEGNDTFANATSISANTQISANIHHSNDNDYYKFTIYSTQYVNIALFDMPLDYDMQIYNGSQSLIATCQKGSDSNSNPYNEVYSASFSGSSSGTTYYIKVYPYNSYSSSNYKLAVSTGRDTVGLNNSYNHSLTSGNRFYSFNLSQTRLMYIKMLESGSNNDFDVYVCKKDSDNTYSEISRAFTTYHPEELYMNLSTGDYLVWVNRYSGSGSSYELTTFSSANVTNYASQIELIGLSSSNINNMTAGEQKTITVKVKNLGSIPWTRSAGFKLNDPYGSEIQSFASMPRELDAGETKAFGQTKEFSITITAPNPSTSPRDYALGFSIFENNTPRGAGIQATVRVTGYTDLNPPFDTTVSGITEKWYRMYLSTGNYIFRTLYTSGSNIDTELTLYNASKTQLTYNDDMYDRATGANPPLYSRLEWNVTSAGYYYLKVGGYGGNPVTCRVTASSYSDTTLNSSADITNQLEGFYKFVAPSTGNYVITTSKYQTYTQDTYLFIQDSSGNGHNTTVLNSNDDGGEGQYSQITRSMTGGTSYYIRVSNYEYAKNAKNTNVYCKLTVSGEAALQPPGNEASVQITSHYNGSLIKVYNDNSIRISGTCYNVKSVMVSVNNSTLSNTKQSGNTFEATFKPTSSSGSYPYIFKVTGVPLYGTSNVTHQVNVMVVVNDDGDDFNSATSITEGTERTAAIDVAGDVDYFKIIPKDSGIYYLTLLGDISTKAVIYGYDKKTQILEIGNGQYSLNLMANNTYYVVVSAKSSGITGQYRLSIGKSHTIRKSYMEESQHPYLNYSYDIKKISEPFAERIRVHFVYIETEAGYDAVSTPDGFWSGNYYDIWSPWVDNYQLAVTLTSDGSTTGNGYLIDMIEYEPSDTAYDLIEELDSPHNYPNNYNNTWVIKYPGVDGIRVHFSTIETQANNDFVRLSTGNQWSGNHSDVWSNWVDGDTITVTLTSNGSITAYGFTIDAIETKKSYSKLR